MHETTGAGFAAEDYQNIKYCSDIGAQKWVQTVYWMPIGKYSQSSISTKGLE
jgi:hypothetical protein